MKATNAPQPSKKAQTFALKDKERVVFYGDSITEQRLYTVFVEAFVLTRFPDRDIVWANTGWSGDTTWGGGGGTSEERIKRDVKPYQPTVVTVMLGMNDGGYVPFDEGIHRTFKESYTKLVSWMKDAAPKARLFLIQTSPYDDVTRPPSLPSMRGQKYNETLLRFGQTVRELAQINSLSFVDFNAPLVETLRCANDKNHPLALAIIPDAIHPAAPGQAIMAGELLKAWNAPSEVTSVELDASKKRVVTASNTKVSQFDGLSWEQRDSALPFAIPKEPALLLAMECARFNESLNRQSLKVTGLAAGNYELTIDDKPIGTFSEEQLASGIDLATLDTPMRRQSLDVLDLTFKRSQLAFIRWREVGLPYHEYASSQQAETSLKKLEEDIRQKQKSAARPLPRHYKLMLKK